MTIDDQIRDEKLQYGINREAANISALSSGKTDKDEYLTGKEILSSNQQQIIEQAKFTYSPLGNDQGEKQSDALESLKPKELKPKEAKPTEYDNYLINGLAEIRNSTKTIYFDNLTYNFKGPNIAPIISLNLKVQDIFLKVYMMAINL